MSLAEIQLRTRELDERIRTLSLSATPPVPAGLAGAAAAGSFAAHLQGAAATAATAPAHAAAAGSGSGDVGGRAVAVAEQQLGTPYRWGGAAPGGFDCSGLVQWTYKQLGVNLPRLASDQARVGTAVSAADARPGDLVFFRDGSDDHIGIYAGNGKWVVAPHTGDVVKVESVDLSKAAAIRRVVPAPTANAMRAAGAAPVGSAAPTDGSLAGLPAAGQQYAAQITAAAQAAGIPPALLASVAWSESGFNPSATSPAGAVGLMQLMPRTAAGLGVDPRDPAQALAGGAAYLASQLKTFGRSDLAIAAYNAGPGAVRKYGGVPPYPETQSYVNTVLGRFRSLGGTP